MATGTARAGFSGSDFSLQPFRRGPDSASLGPEAPPEGGPSWLKTGRDPGNSDCRTGRASDSQFRPSFYKRGNPDQGGRCRTKRHAHQRKSLDKGPGGLTGHPFGCRLDHLPLRTPPASLLQSPALPCPEFVTRRARGVARRVSPKSTGAPCWQELRAATPSRSCPRPAVGTRLQVLSIPGSLYHFKEISITRRCFYIDLHFSWGGWDS